jgi:hypothetical protein
MVAGTTHATDIVICEGGTNSPNHDTVLAEFATMRAAIPHDHFIFCGMLTNNVGQPYGTAISDLRIQIDNSMNATYPGHYISLQQTLLDAMNLSDSNELAAYNQGVTTDALQADHLHPSDRGQIALTTAIWNKMNALGMIENVPITTSIAILHEPATTNLALSPRDLTNAAFVKVNCTAAKTATGTDGVINSASTLTATAANATCLQTITSASANRITGCFLKRRTGTGVINMTQDNGATWTPITVPATWGSAALVLPAATLANPIIGLQIVTSGDAIDVDWTQHELGSYITSPISGSRTIDSNKVPLVANVNFPQLKGIAIIKLTMQFANSATAKSLLCTNSAATDFIHDNGSGEIAINDGTNTAATIGLGGWAAGDTLLFASAWNATDALMGISVSKNGGAFVDSPDAAYDGAFPAGTNFLLANANPDAVLFNAVKIKSTKRAFSRAKAWALSRALGEAQ